MDVVRVPSWWYRKDTELREGTVDLLAKSVIRTRTDLISHRRADSLPYKSCQNNQNSNDKNESKCNNQNQDVIFIDFPTAGKRPSSRDQRDRATIIEVLNPYSDLCTTKTLDARDGKNNQMFIKPEKYISLRDMKEMRVLIERQSAHDNFDKLLKSKAERELRKKAEYDQKVKLKIKTMPETPRSYAAPIKNLIDDKAPSLVYIDDPLIKTQRQLNDTRKADLLKQFKKCESICVNHVSSEKRLENREQCFLRMSYKEPKNIENK